MGVVYAARDRQLEREVAIKLLVRGELRLLREARAMAKVSHPNVVTIHEVNEDRGFIVMGMTLGHWLKETPRRWVEILVCFRAAARGLIAVHTKALIHRDFKPHNMMMSHDGRVRVMDFGLACWSDQQRG